jgi:hypothetical protein
VHLIAAATQYPRGRPTVKKPPHGCERHDPERHPYDCNDSSDPQEERTLRARQTDKAPQIAERLHAHIFQGPHYRIRPMSDRRRPSSAARVAEDMLRKVMTEECVPETGLSSVEFDALWKFATTSRVHLILGSKLLERETLIPVERRQAVVECLRHAQVLELLRRRELCRIVAAFHAADVPMLLLKGAGLAYTVYAAPHLRPACDIDLFVAPDTLASAENALSDSGYRRRLEPDVELASGQRHYDRDDPLGKQVVDLHWRVSNVHLFAGMLSFEQAWESSVAIPRLGQAARTLGRIDALLFACVHRVAHHYDDPDLLWLWDINLLCRDMTDDEAGAILKRAALAHVCSVIARSLTLTRAAFGTVVPIGLLERLDAAGRSEDAAHFIGGHVRQMDVLRSDLAAGSMRSNLRLLREHLFPPRVYMRRTYAGWPTVFMPVAYLHRICRGAPKWFVRP